MSEYVPPKHCPSCGDPISICCCHPLRAVVDGRTWRTYTCSYDTADGKFCFTIMALSMEHAAAMLEELKTTAKLDGELDEICSAGR